MPDYDYAKTSEPSALARIAARDADARRDTARISELLTQCHGNILNIEESVAIARNALWGPMPEKAGRDPNIKAVEPSGFLPATVESLVTMIRRLEALAESARTLRNL